MAGQALWFAGPGMRASVHTTPDLASTSISVPLAAVHNTGPGTARIPRQILVLKEGVVPQPWVPLEQSAARMLGPLWRSDHVHISPVGLVPKVIRVMHGG